MKVLKYLQGFTACHHDDGKARKANHLPGIAFLFLLSISTNTQANHFHPDLFPFQGIALNPTPPVLVIKENSLVFTDTNGNGRLDAGEIATVEFVLRNIGNGSAQNLKVVSKMTGSTEFISVITSPIPELLSRKEYPITVILKAGMNLRSGKAMILIRISEPNGLDSKTVEVGFNTLAFQPPNVIAADGLFTSGSRTTLMMNYPTNLEVIVQNTGTGNAEEITTQVKLPENVISLDQPHLPIARLRPGESVLLNTGFIVTANYNAQEVPIKIILREKYGRYGSENIFTAHVDQPLSMRVSVPGEELRTDPVIRASLHSEVDREIPVNTKQYANRYGLVIGNEDYQSFQPGLQRDQNVAFANNDAVVFKEYLVKTLGFPEKQVFLLMNATRGQLSRELDRLTELAKLSPGAEVVFYYAGHGLPDMETHQGYLIPVDVTASDLKEGIRLGGLYSKLAASKASKVTVFLDACFSGGGRGENGLLAGRTVKVKPKGEVVEGNVIVFAATSDEEVSMPFTRESHGLFTYFLLRKLKESKGNITMKELSTYLSGEVPRTSLLENGIKQTPQLLVAPDLGDVWMNWKF